MQADVESTQAEGAVCAQEKIRQSGPTVLHAHGEEREPASWSPSSFVLLVVKPQEPQARVYVSIQSQNP